ncbi:MAG: hypothetical protein CM1200mP23_3110 [Nitrososphaerota archaeon]|nr:MAG: hypothetical protein CM1200mP23_3110 [Nitrososphaerota archaeon]
MPLQMAGIVSTDSFEKVTENFENISFCIKDEAVNLKNLT